MADTLPLALQLCPFSPEMEAGLAQRFTLERWFERDGDAQAGWLDANRDAVRAVVTGGHIGCPQPLMDALPALGIIAINGVGFDKVDVPAAAARGIHVTTTPGVLTDDVADLGVGLVIALLRGIVPGDGFVRAGNWLKGERPLARKVSGQRFGVLGLGQIGSALAKRLEAFGPIHYSDSARRDVPYTYHESAVALAEACDVLLVACAANEHTRGLVNAEVLGALGPQGYIVNVSRGSVVDEPALEAALAAGTIAGAALDVFADEPRVPQGLIARDNTVLTPHVASATAETRRAMGELVLANLDAFLAGQVPPSRLEPR